jgi:hypothetical protein
MLVVKTELQERNWKRSRRKIEIRRLKGRNPPKKEIN